MGICGYPLRQRRAKLRRHGGELVEFAMVSGIVGLDVRQVDHGRAQLCKLGHAGIVANSGDAASDGSGEPQRLIVLGQHDIERPLQFAEAAQL